MKNVCRQIGDSVLLNICGPYLHIELNSPATLNTLDSEFLAWLHQAVDMVEEQKEVRLLMISGRGPKGFCAGGNLKVLAQAVKRGKPEVAMEFFRREYELNLRIHELETPLVVLAQGICMGGGLGLAAGADLVIATETTRMAMPETLIGFFPDVGSTRWLFDKTPPGYPEYLGLLGPDINAEDCVRVGLATHLVPQNKLWLLVEDLESSAAKLPPGRDQALDWLEMLMKRYSSQPPEENPERDFWVGRSFDGVESPLELARRLESQNSPRAQKALADLALRSPTCLTLTAQLMQLNRMTPQDAAFKRELNAARFIINHPDFLEGVRSRLVDKDNSPAWRPGRLEEVGRLDW
jgi:enoyl-CoA hydratase